MRIIAVEATPAEVADSKELQDLMRRITDASSWTLQVTTPAPDEGDGDSDAVSPGLPTAIRQFIERNCARAQFARAEELFLTKAIEHHGVRLDPWEGSSKYIKIYSHGHDKGAVVYLTPSSGRLHFRLPPKAAENYVHAFVPDRRRAADAYKVGLVLASIEAVDEALELLARAINSVNTWNPSAQ